MEEVERGRAAGKNIRVIEKDGVIQFKKHFFSAEFHPRSEERLKWITSATGIKYWGLNFRSIDAYVKVSRCSRKGMGVRSRLENRGRYCFLHNRGIFNI